MIIPILQLKKPAVLGVEQLAQGHRPRKWGPRKDTGLSDARVVPDFMTQPVWTREWLREGGTEEGRLCRPPQKPSFLSLWSLLDQG